MTIDEQQYPIGLCHYPETYTDELLKQYKLDIETFPMRLEQVVQHLDADQLQATYRAGGWTINQVIHHCGDSHINAIIRIKLALTEENPSINPYKEELWAETADYDLPFNNTVTLLFAVHRKLITLLNSLGEEQLNRTYYHAQYQRKFSVKDVMCLYAWHGNHHLAHIRNAITQFENGTI
jgi:hypothetical protein